MTRLPRDKGFDSTWALVADPYGFISKRCRRHGSDLFETRLLLRKTICMSGPVATQLFYDTNRFQRGGAPPTRIQKILFGTGGVQGLDAQSHRHRKRLFLSLLTDEERIRSLARQSLDQWERCAEKWSSMQRVVLYDETHELLTRAACAWAGVPLAESEVARRVRQISALFDAAGSIGPRHWWARLERKRANRWIASLVRDFRGGRLGLSEQTILGAIARHHDLEGKPLDLHTAAVEVLNIMRPIVAVGVYITFVAHALARFTACRDAYLSGDDAYGEHFVQEVRRFYPFFPAVVARVRDEFEWNGYHFPRGRRVMLDLFGTNHDERIWNAPEEFRPERFREVTTSPYNFIPQGGGDHEQNHRCPGEPITIELMKVALNFLIRRIEYEVPDQDLHIDMARLPALPRSRFVMRNVTPVALPG